MSQKGRLGLRKEGFIFLYSFALAYICYEMNKLQNDFFCLRKEDFFFYERKVLSTKGRFYYRIYCSTYIYLLQN